MSEINWRNKYEALKAKFMDSVDAAYRIGFEQGGQQAQMESMMQQQQQQADQMAAQNNGAQEDPNQDPNAQQPQDAAQEQVPADSSNPQGSELDQHISQLEGMLGKGELDMVSLVKAVKGMKDLQKSMVLQSELKKSAMAIPAIAKAMHKPKFKLGVGATHNMNNSAKKAVSMQSEIVEGIMKSWDEETKKTSNNIINHLKVEGLLKEDK